MDENIMTEFEENVVIITGAARGIGMATVLEFSKRGANVVIVDVLEQELGELEKKLRKMGNKALPIKADVSDKSQVEDVVKKTLDKFGKIDILINNAGIAGPVAPIVDLTEEDWDKVFRINLKSMFLFCKQVVPVMTKNKRGRVINIASIAGKEGNENLAPYSASKAGVICFSRVLAKEVVKYGIRVNCIAPAVINTPILSTLPQKTIDTLVAKIPMGRMGYSEEVANLILFLSSERSSFITGQCINITGGRGDY